MQRELVTNEDVNAKKNSSHVEQAESGLGVYT